MKGDVRATTEVVSRAQRLRSCECFVWKSRIKIKQWKRKHSLVNILRVDGAKSELMFCVFGSQVTGRWMKGAGRMLLLVTVFLRRWWWWRWRCQMLSGAPLRLLWGGCIGQHEGVRGVSASAKRSQAAQVAGRPRQPYLGSLRGSHHAAADLRLRQPWWDLHRVLVQHEGWILNSSWMK